MGRSLWDIISTLGRTGQEAQMPAELERALRAVRPSPPEVTPARTETLLAQALSEARTPRSSSRHILRAAVFGAACAGMAIWILSIRRPAVSVAGMPTPIVRTSVRKRPGSIASVVRFPATRKHRVVANLRVARKSRRTPMVVGYRGLAARKNRIMPFDSVRFEPRGPQNRVVPTEATVVAHSTVLHGGEPLPSGHMVLVVSGGPSTELHVELTHGPPTNTGFAKVEAYRPIGPGGGVLTECTVRENIEQDEEYTTQYGIVYGYPVTRLNIPTTAPSTGRRQEEREMKP